MSEELKPSGPVCPHCNSSPMGLNVRDMVFPNGLVVLLAWCATPECQKLITASFLGKTASNGPRIVRPD